MIRTQIQLTEEQAARLRAVAEREGVSQAEVIRRAVNALDIASAGVGPETRRKRAVEAAGRFASGRADVSRDHDAHLAEALGG